MAVVERQESIDGELTAEVVVLPTEHLFTHARPDLRLEIQDGAKTKITTLPALIVLRVLDPAPAPKGRHTREDILVEMETLLRL